MLEDRTGKVSRDQIVKLSFTIPSSMDFIQNTQTFIYWAEPCLISTSEVLIMKNNECIDSDGERVRYAR